jgi:hypothetical protein
MFLYTFEAGSLSSLFSSLSSDVDNACFSVDVDQFSPNRLNNVKKIGFIAKLGSDGKFDFDVMDTVIQYRQIQAEVFVQVPHDFAMEPRDLLVLANSVDANVILMPPAVDAGLEAWELWQQLTLRYADAMLGFNPFAKELLPVTSYVQYMIMRVAGYQPATLTDDPMMKHFFEDGMNVPVMDAIKAALDIKIHDAHGGKQGFESFVHGTLAGLYDRVEERSQDVSQTFISWIDEAEVDHVGYVMTAFMNALGITDKPFLDLMIDMASDARKADQPILKTIREHLAPAGRDKIPSIYFEDTDVTVESLSDQCTLVYDFLSRIIPA